VAYPKRYRVIVNLKEISQFGVWEMGLLTSFKKEKDGLDILPDVPRHAAAGWER
jgi:hypothetical protein